MNLVFINHMHPVTPHVSGMRAWYFAREMAGLGHRVVQICQWREGTEPAPEPGQLPQRLRSHDWAEPLLLAISPQPFMPLSRVRAAETAAPLRKLLVLWNYLRHSGVFTDFSEGVQPYLPVLAREFRPEATWGLFGNTDCWLIAQRLARLSGCPWVADMKDSWDVFMPKALRHVIALRFRDMSASTANAAFNARVLERWFSPKPAVVYSGADRCFGEAVPALLGEGLVRLTLTGSIPEKQSLDAFVDGLMCWLSRRPSAGSVQMEIVYAGGDGSKAQHALARLEGMAQVTVRPYLPLPALAALCRSAAINAYIRTPRGFHHKLLELLACGQPVLAFPGETEEAQQLAADSGGELFCPASHAELATALNLLLARPLAPVPLSTGRDSFTWTAQAIRLEQVFRQAIEGSGT